MFTFDKDEGKGVHTQHSRKAWWKERAGLFTNVNMERELFFCPWEKKACNN